MNCPICRAPVTRPETGREGTYPFCSKRCQLADLGHWLDGAYRVADRPVEGYRSGVNPAIGDDPNDDRETH